jgi:hypothetical protein
VFVCCTAIWDNKLSWQQACKQVCCGLGTLLLLLLPVVTHVSYSAVWVLDSRTYSVVSNSMFESCEYIRLAKRVAVLGFTNRFEPDVTNHALQVSNLPVVSGTLCCINIGFWMCGTC